MISKASQDRINQLKKELTRCPDYANEASKFNALGDFERRVILQAAGVQTTYLTEQITMAPVRRFDQLKKRDQVRVAKVFPMLAALGAKVAA